MLGIRFKFILIAVFFSVFSFLEFRPGFIVTCTETIVYVSERCRLQLAVPRTFRQQQAIGPSSSKVWYLYNVIFFLILAVNGGMLCSFSSSSNCTYFVVTFSQRSLFLQNTCRGGDKLLSLALRLVTLVFFFNLYHLHISPSIPEKLKEYTCMIVLSVLYLRLYSMSALTAPHVGT